MLCAYVCGRVETAGVISYKQGKEATHRVSNSILDAKTKRYSGEAEEMRDILVKREWWTGDDMTWDDVMSHEQMMTSRKVSKQKKARIL